MNIVFVLLSLVSFAMPSPLRVKPGSALNVRAGSLANGGHANEEFSLLSVLSTPVTGGERIVLSYGDRFGKVWKGEPGFFQVALDKGGSRVVIDLSQVTKTGIDPVQLRKALAASKLVASSDMTMDPQDQTTNLTLVMKQPVTLALSTSSGARSQIVLDLKGQ